MKLRLDHVAVLVANATAAGAKFGPEGLGLPAGGTEEIPTENARVAFYEMGGGAHLELVEPTGEGSALTKRLQEKGEGIHHLCFEVDDIEAAMRLVSALGLKLINDEPRPGAAGSRVAFIHPKSLHGVLVELVEKAQL